jgi:hypothetical protein
MKGAIREYHCDYYIPGLRENTDMGNAAALIANRGVFVETGGAAP